MKLHQYLTAILFLSILPLMHVKAETVSSSDYAEIKDVIDIMNDSVTSRDLNGVLNTFADGAINIELFPAKKYGETKTDKPIPVKTRTLGERWKSIAPILFGTTKKYLRKATIADLLVDGNLAVARLDVETEALSSKEGAIAKQASFREICILRRYDNGWKIVTLTNNLHDEAR